MGEVYIWILSQWNHKEKGLLSGWSLRFTAFGNTQVECRQDKYWRWHCQPIKVHQSAWLWSIIYDLTWTLWVGGEGPCLKGLNMRDEGLKTEGEVRDDFLSEHINCVFLSLLAGCPDVWTM